MKKQEFAAIKLWAVLIILIFLVSCSNEKTKIKNALKSSIPESLRSEYKYNSYILIETVLKSNLSDSIASFENNAKICRQMVSVDSMRLANIRYNLVESKHQKATAPYYLRYAYDDIIDSYEEMEAEILVSINERKQTITNYENQIKFFHNAMKDTDSPIVFYKVKHNYKIHGMYKDTTLLLNSKYEII